jgi:hypothetical protein
MSLSGLHSCIERCTNGKECGGVMYLVSLGCAG